MSLFRQPMTIMLMNPKKRDVPSQNPPSGRIEVMQPADAYRDTGQDGEHDD
jgi:hypothetical protein